MAEVEESRGAMSRENAFPGVHSGLTCLAEDQLDGPQIHRITVLDSRRLAGDELAAVDESAVERSRLLDQIVDASFEIQARVPAGDRAVDVRVRQIDFGLEASDRIESSEDRLGRGDRER